MERFKPDLTHHIWYEHWHRYHFIQSLIKDKYVCDIACGEGYGSALISFVAKAVVGVDIDKETIQSAQKKYQASSNLKFVTNNALQTQFNNDEFDVVVSFETLEHLVEHEELLTEFKRILKPDGLLIISTPDKNAHSDSDVENHYHEKELTLAEFDKLIDCYFNYNLSFGQQFQLLSSISLLNTDSSINKETTTYVKKGQEANSVKNKVKTQYCIKICSDDSEALRKLDVTNTHYFADDENRLYQHYVEQIQRLMKIDSQNNSHEQIIAKQAAVIAHLQARLGY